MYLRLILIYISFFSSLVLAVESSEKMDFGRFHLEPTIVVNIENDDNLFESSSNEIDVTLIEFVPSFKLDYSGTLLLAKFNYSIYSGSYDDSPEDDYNDHILETSLSYLLTRRSSIDLSVNYSREHTKRTSDDLDFNSFNSPDEYDEKIINFAYTFGRDKAKGRIKLFTEVTDKEYTNNRISTIDDDREQTLFGANFQLRLNPRSSAFVEISREDFDYINDPQATIGSRDTLDSERDQYFAGFRWNISAKSDGEIKLGYTKKSFTDTDREDFSAFSWQANVQWDLNTQSTLRFNTSRQDKESDQGITGGYIDELSYGLSIEKEWGSKLISTVKAKYITSEYIDYTQNRDESLFSYGLRLDYAVQRWLDIGFSIDVETNDATSDVDDFDYDRSRYGLHITAGF